MKLLTAWGNINLSFNNYLEYFSHGWRNFYCGNLILKSDPRRFEPGLPVSQDSRARGGVGVGGVGSVGSVGGKNIGIRRTPNSQLSPKAQSTKPKS